LATIHTKTYFYSEYRVISSCQFVLIYLVLKSSLEIEKEKLDVRRNLVTPLSGKAEVQCVKSEFTHLGIACKFYRQTVFCKVNAS
jgi:hypothetical protein